MWLSITKVNLLNTFSPWMYMYMYTLYLGPLTFFSPFLSIPSSFLFLSLFLSLHTPFQLKQITLASGQQVFCMWISRDLEQVKSDLYTSSVTPIDPMRTQQVCTDPITVIILTLYTLRLPFVRLCVGTWMYILASVLGLLLQRMQSWVDYYSRMAKFLLQATFRLPEDFLRCNRNVACKITFCHSTAIIQLRPNSTP